MENNNPVRRNGYLYSPRTKKGFARMQRMGIPQPLFRLEDGVTRGLAEVYKNIINSIAIDFVTLALQDRMTFSRGELVTDASDITKQIAALVKSQGYKQFMEAHPEFVNKANVLGISERMKLFYMEHYGVSQKTASQIRDRMDGQFYDDQKQFFQKFFADADPKMSQLFTSFSIDKNQVFSKNIDNLRKLYIDNAIGRIDGETNELRKMFLQKLVDYAEGRSDTLDIDEVTREMQGTSARVARFFARDQLSRFNKALTLSTFHAAGVKTLRWATVGDERVRPTHRALNGRTFSVDDLPKEIDDYNCRCGLVPVEYYDD